MVARQAAIWSDMRTAQVSIVMDQDRRHGKDLLRWPWLPRGTSPPRGTSGAVLVDGDLLNRGNEYVARFRRRSDVVCGSPVNVVCQRAALLPSILTQLNSWFARLNIHGSDTRGCPHEQGILVPNRKVAETASSVSTANLPERAGDGSKRG